MGFDVGDRVRIDIPDADDPDHELHGEHGSITDVLDDDAHRMTGTDDSRLFRVKLDSGTIVDVREWDVREPFHQA